MFEGAHCATPLSGSSIFAVVAQRLSTGAHRAQGGAAGPRLESPKPRAPPAAPGIRDDRDTGRAKLPVKQFALNEVWVEIVTLAHDLIVWTQALCLDDELAAAEPKRLRHRLIHVAARLAFSGRQGKLHLPTAWPWTHALIAAFKKLRTLVWWTPMREPGAL